MSKKVRKFTVKCPHSSPTMIGLFQFQYTTTKAGDYMFFCKEFIGMVDESHCAFHAKLHSMLHRQSRSDPACEI
uniref:Uncharacterized protein n=1 Tax=Anguilla anguilla TaxID=7936 RepID=A0A0E9SZQ7_ANGAN